MKLLGLTKSISEPHGEFVLHIKDEYDYRMKSDSRDQIIEMIKKTYYNLQNSNVPIYGVVTGIPFAKNNSVEAKVAG